MILSSPAFKQNHLIPRNYSGDGDDMSPALSWSEVPPATKELALIVDDPDAPTPEPWVHWVLYKIPAATMDLAEHVPPALHVARPVGALQGRNSWPKGIGYRGPAPPKGHGLHHYHFRLYALDAATRPGTGRRQGGADQGHAGTHSGGRGTRRDVPAMTTAAAPRPVRWGILGTARIASKVARAIHTARGVRSSPRSPAVTPIAQRSWLDHHTIGHASADAKLAFLPVGSPVANYGSYLELFASPTSTPCTFPSPRPFTANGHAVPRNTANTSSAKNPWR